MSSVVSYDIDQLAPILASLNIYLRKEDYRLDSKQLLKIVCMEYFRGTNCIVDMLVEHISNPKQGGFLKFKKHYSG